MADKLKLTLEAIKRLGGTDNVEAYELYLIAYGKEWSFDSSALQPALEAIDTAISLDSKFALAWANKADIHQTLARLGSANLAAAELDAGLKAAQKAIEIEPDLAEAYAALGTIKSSNGELIEAGEAYQKAAKLATIPLSMLPGYIPHLEIIGYLEKALEILELDWRSDPLNSNIRLFEAELFGLRGDLQRAEDLYEFYGDDCSLCNMFITLARLGSGSALSSEDILTEDILTSDPVFDAAKEYLDSPEEGLSALRRIYSDGNMLSGPGSYAGWLSIPLWATYFGDPEFAMEVLEKIANQTAFMEYIGKDIWFPVMHDVRQLPRFKEFVREIGLVDYWNQFGWPDLCHPTDDGDFVCD